MIKCLLCLVSCVLVFILPLPVVVQERDDELARKLVTQAGDDKDDDMEDVYSSSAVHIQLAMSETKPFTRYSPLTPLAWPERPPHHPPGR